MITKSEVDLMSSTLTDRSERAFMARICRSPTDMITRRVFADYLEDRDRISEATFWLWAADVGISPTRHYQDGWDWLPEGNHWVERGYRTAVIPEILYELDVSGQCFLKVHHAWEALLKKWLSLSVSDRPTNDWIPRS